MKDRRLEEKPVCTVKDAPVPSEVTCPHCSMDLEIWSDEGDISCSSCGATVHG